MSDSASNYVKHNRTTKISVDIEGTIEGVHIIEVSVLSGLNLKKMKGLSFPRVKTNYP